VVSDQGCDFNGDGGGCVVHLINALPLADDKKDGAAAVGHAQQPFDVEGRFHMQRSAPDRARDC